MSSTNKYRLSDFFNAHWDKYVKKPTRAIFYEQYKAVNAMRVCKTVILGVNYYACSKCGEITKTYHSCKNRFCPNCLWKDTLKWAEKIEAKLLKIKHRHIIFSVPHALNSLIKNNKELRHNILLRTSADTFKDWFLSKYNIKTGAISVLHTFGEKKNWHSHVHSIIPWGGIHAKTGKLIEIKNNYVNYKFLRNKFRIKFEKQLIEAYDKNLLYNNFDSRMEFMLFIKSLNQTDWQIQIEKPITKLDVVIRYIGRYSKRACLSESKITDITGEYITFKYKDNKDKDQQNKPKEKELKLHYRDFFPRLLQHVPPTGFQIVRYYEIYSNATKIPTEYRNKSTEIADEKTKYKDPTFCEHCNCQKIYLFTIFDSRFTWERTEKFDYKKHKHNKIYYEIKQKQTA